MSPQIIRFELGILMTLGFALSLSAQEYVRIPNDRTGVGAMGKIGRGTSPGERFVSPSMPARTPPVFLYAPTPMPVQTPPAPAQINVNPTESVDRAAIRSVEPAVDLPALARGNPYSAYHRGWVHGYWTARLPNSWSRPTPGYAGPTAASWKGPGSGLGMGLGWGLSAWLVGPMAYTWAYFHYENPYFGGRPAAETEPPSAWDYSRPINAPGAPPTETLLHDALAGFRAARAAFQQEDYSRALDQADAALRLMPNDPMLHQFRALALFALRRYDESAATLHAVLAVVPGWDWTTMISLYSRPETYTRQLRLLEDYCHENPRAAAGRFVRAYHYLTAGYAEEAVGQWERVVATQSSDQLSAQLIQELRSSKPGAGTQAAQTSTPSPALAAPSGRPGALQGTWTAHPRSDTTITVTFQHRGHLIWKVSRRGRDRLFEGFSVYVNGSLTLVQDEDNAMVGTVHWQDDHHFIFTLLGGGAGDAGLSFAKSA